MWRRTLAFLLLTAAGTLVAQEPEIGSQVKPDLQHFTVEQLFNTRTIGSSCWSPDGSTIAFVTNIAGRMNIWTMPATGGWPVQLTISEEAQTDLSWSPDGKLIAYAADFGGDELFDLFVLSPETGQSINLTNTRQVSEQGLIWSSDGKSVAFARKPKESSSYEVCVRELSQPRILALTSGTASELTNWPVVFTRDGKYLVYNQARADDKDSNIFLVDMSTAKSKNLTMHKGEAVYLATDVSPDGTKILMISNSVNGSSNAGLLDIASGKITWLTNETWEVGSGNYSPDGKYVTWTTNVDGNIDVYLRDLATARTWSVPVKKGVNTFDGTALPFSSDSKKLLIRHSGADSPNDLWIYDLAGEKAVQLTTSLVGGMRASDFVTPFLVHYPSYDGRQISAFLYIPHNLRRTGSNPGVVWVHGGPTGQSMNGFSRGIQYLVNNGYVVIAPNYRGSTGYGKAFEDLNRFDMGGGDLMDILHATQYLVLKTGYVSPKRLVVYGGSYGGYLTMMALTKKPEIWAAGVDLFGFVNWSTEIQNEDPALRQYDLATMGDPVKDKARYDDRSPINFVDKIQSPLLVMVGSNDPRCPKSESDQIVDAVKKKGGIVEYKIYENEGHGFQKRENQIDSFKRTVEFLDKYVKNKEIAGQPQQQ